MTFALPDGIELAKGVCEFELSGTKSIKVKISPKCPFPPGSKTRVIVIELRGNGVFWINSTRSVWVSICFRFY